jgi:leucyl-tRNA synthetase
MELAVQVNGKLRGQIQVPVGASREEVEQLAVNEPNVRRFLENKQVMRVIVVPGRLVNVVIG